MSALSYRKSPCWPYAPRKVILTMAETAAKMPSDRVAVTADLTFQFICTFHSSGTGRRAKIMSVRAATLELKNAANLRCDGGMQVPSTDVSQVRARGRHWKKTVTVQRVSLGSFTSWSSRKARLQKFPVAQRTVKIMVLITIHLSRRDVVRRSRKKPTLTLVRYRPIRHSGCVTKFRCSPFVTFSGG